MEEEDTISSAQIVCIVAIFFNNLDGGVGLNIKRSKRIRYVFLTESNACKGKTFKSKGICRKIKNP